MAPPKVLGICEVPDCGKNATGKRYCNVHYQRWRRHGTPTPGPRDETAHRLALLMKKVTFEPNSGCWLWLGTVAHWGHGVMVVNGKYRPAHRVAWELLRGQIPTGLIACHKCDVPGCVNPDHIFLGTVAENFNDMRKKKRNPIGERVGSAKLSRADVLAIRMDNRTTTAIAAEYRVSTVLISKIKRGEVWSHLPLDAVYAPKGRKLTLQQAREIKNSEGTCKSVAARYGVDPMMVSLIRRGKTWAEA